MKPAGWWKCAKQPTGNGFEPMVGQLRQRTAGALQGAAGMVGERQAEPAAFVAEEGYVKAGVVGDQRMRAKELEERRVDFVCRGLSMEHRVSDAMDAAGMVGNGPAGGYQGYEFADNLPRLDGHGADFDDPIAPTRGKAGGFDIDGNKALHPAGRQMIPCSGPPGAPRASTRRSTAGSSSKGGAWWGLRRASITRGPSHPQCLQRLAAPTP